MAVPVETNLLALCIDDAADKLDDFARAIRRRMSDCVADADRARAALNRRRVKQHKRAANHGTKQGI